MKPLTLTRGVLSVAALACLVNLAAAQPTTTTSAEPVLRDIVRNCNYTDAHLRGYRKVEQTVTEPGEGGSRTGYLSHGQLRKITSLHFGELGRTRDDFYYKQGRLIFVLAQEFHYNHHISAPGRLKVVARQQQRYYFHDGAMLRWVNEDKHDMAPGTSKFKDAAATIITESQEALTALISKA